MNNSKAFPILNRNIIMPIVYAMPSFIVWTISLLAFSPALMTFDSMDEWSQAMSGHFTDNLPVIYALFIRLLTRVWASPAIIAIIQILILGVIAGLWIHLLERLGVPIWLCWLTSILFAFSPINLLYPIILWKDILYSAGVLLLTYILFKWVWQDESLVKNVVIQIGLGILLGCIALLRYNGIAVALAVTALAFALFRQYRKAWLRIFLFGFGIWLFFQGVVYPVIRVQHLYPLEMLTIHQVAAYLHSGIPLTVDEQTYLNHISSINSGWNYNCSDNVTTFGTKGFNLGVVLADRIKFYKIYTNLIFRRPDILLKHSLCSSKIVWSLQKNQESHETPIPLWPIEDNNSKFSNLNLHTASFLPSLRLKITMLEQKILDHPYLGIIWRPAIYLYIGVAIIIFLAFRWKSIALLLPALPILIQSISLIFTTPSYAFRFQYAIYLVTMLMWSALFITKPPKSFTLPNQN